MKFEYKESNKVVAENQVLAHAFELPHFFHFAVSTSCPCTLNYVDLFFKTENFKDSDSLEIRIVANERSYAKYALRYADLKNNAPLRLMVEKPLQISDRIDVYLVHPSESSPLYLWINGKGPCYTINGDATRFVELPKTPLISVLVPLYKTPIKYMQEMVESVTNQIYTKWELCLVNDGSHDPVLSLYLSKLKNKQIKLKSLRKNGGIAKATNEALSMATGEYACLLDHDDKLAPDALLEVVSAINRNEKAELVYSDEDKILDDGRHVEPFYKPDWSYNLLLSQNYVCHLSVFKTKTLRDIGGMNPSCEGSQDYDLLLRMSEVLEEDKIEHIPKILYHWRKHDDSTAKSMSVKPIAHLSAMKALKDHLRRKGEHPVVTVGPFIGTYRVRYRRRSNPVVNVIIPTRDNPLYLETCLFSVLQSTYPALRITVIDNGSKNPEVFRVLSTMQDYPQCEVLKYDLPFNYSAINNYAVANSRPAKCYLFLNDDTEVITVDWVEQMLQHIGRDGVKAVGAKLLYGNNAIQHAGVIIGIGGVAGHSHKHVSNSSPGYFSRPHLVQNVSAVTGACLLVDSKTFEDVGGFEEELPRAFNDVDLCLKIRAKGHKIVYTPYACLYHHESISRGLDNHKEAEFAKAIQYMQDKWNCKDFKDPYYNPNLTLVSENFSFRTI